MQTNKINMRGENIKETFFHDAGAEGRCSNCGRYSDSKVCLSKVFTCDCGKAGYYTGSFKKPNENSKWCVGFLIEPPL